MAVELGERLYWSAGGHGMLMEEPRAAEWIDGPIGVVCID